MPDRLPQVLVCDDTPAKRYVLSSWLRRDGYRVIEAETVSQARAILHERPIELAVLDVHLPDGSGMAITKELKSDPERSGIPVVHVSAVAVDTVDKVAGLDGGADAYFVDPIDPQEFLSTIRALLRSSGARREAEVLARRLSELNRAAVRLNLASTVARLGDAVARAACEVFREPAVAVLLLDGIAHRAFASPGGAVDGYDEISADLTTRLIAEVGILTTVEANERPWQLVLPTTGHTRWRVRKVHLDDGPAGLVAVPATDQQSNDDFLLDRLSQLTSVALDNLRSLEREHRTAFLLQRSLLPTSLPTTKGISLAARYRASERHAEVGGDFYDAFVVDGDLFAAIGDVQGHSLEAAVVMAELRYSMRAYAYDGYGPGGVTDRVDGVLVRSEPGVTATGVVVQIAADRRSMRLVRAGHVPAMLVRDGRTQVLDPKGILLGLGSTHVEHHFDLEPGDLVVLMTDGLVERRHEPIDDSIAKVAELAARFDGDVEELADLLLHERAADRTEPLADDIALLLVHVAE